MAKEQPFTLGVDIDGVLGDYNAVFAQCWSAQSGIPVDQLPAPTSWSFPDCGWGFTDTAHFLEAHRRAVDEQAMFLKMQPLPGASEALWALSDAGVHITVLSHRILGKRLHRKVVSDTLAWLDLHDLPYSNLAIVGGRGDGRGGSKAEFVPALSIHIDDAPHNVLAMREAAKTYGVSTEVVVMDQPYNQDVPGPRVHSWGEMTELVLARLASR